MKGKRVVISGAASGIGAAIFVRLLESRAYPIGVDILPFAGSELLLKMKSIYGYDVPVKRRLEFTLIQADASCKDDFEKKFFKEFMVNFCSVGGLVNCAGLLGNDPSHGGRSLESFDKMMGAHAKTAFTLTEVIYPLMNYGGAIVNIGSIETFMAAPDVVLYASAKGALHAMTIAYATTLCEKKIRVNMVSPGNVNTERNKAQYKAPETKKIIGRFEKRTPLKRSVEPEEVAEAVMFLLSDKSSAITGQEIIIDCGYTRALWDPGWSEK